MPNFIRMTTIEDPRLADYANLRDRELKLRLEDNRTRHGLFIAEGELVVRILIESRYPTRSVLVADERVDGMMPWLLKLPEGTPVYTGGRGLVGRIVGFDLHRGVLAIGERVANPALADLLEACRGVTVMEDLTNHDNIGAMFRNTAALGGPEFGVVLSRRCADPLYRKSVRVSMGHVLRTRFAIADDWLAGLMEMKASGYLLFALTPRPNAITIQDASELLTTTQKKPAVLVGAEYQGLSEDAMREADVRVRIPIHTGVDSLNAAVAGAIALHRLGWPREQETDSSV